MKLAERKASALAGSSKEALLDELKTLKKEQFNLRFQKVNGSISDTSRAKWVRRKIALVHTLLTAKKLAG